MATTEIKTGPRGVRRTVRSQRTTEGGGFVVRRPFPVPGLDQIDPFLLIDHLGPVDYGPGEAVGAPDHPHRGFETVTYLLEGEQTHADSAGNHGVLRAGDVQWMTAGRGVVHAEMPSERLVREGGRTHGFQIWVNLPKADKMAAPRYQDVPAATIPVVTTDDGAVLRVIAGSAYGQRGAVETHTPIEYVHATLPPGTAVEVPAPSTMNAMAYVISGAGTFGPHGAPGAESDLVVFADDGDVATLANAADADGPLDVLVLAGEPLREPIARYGPFVMNSRSELVQAVEDYEAGRMGAIV